MPAHRRSLRVECAMPVHWSTHRRTRSGAARLCNLHGLFIATPHSVAVNYIVDLTLEMPWGSLSCIVVPRFCGDSPDGRGIGVELHVMDAGDRELWNTHYRRTLAMQGVSAVGT